MANVLQQLNWVMLLSQRTDSLPSSRRYRKAWRRLLSTLSSLRTNSNSPTDSDTELDTALERLYYHCQNRGPADLNSLREFANVVAAQSGDRIPRADANILIGAAQEIIELLMAG